jgi:hypothetical protein
MSEIIPDDPFAPAITLIYSEAALQIPESTKLIERFNTILDPCQDESIQVSWRVQDAEKCLGECRFGEHAIRIIGASQPLPQEIVNRTILVTHWQPQVKSAMRQHAAHIKLIYTGTHHDAVEKMIALYQLAHALENENLLGIVNENAWTAHPAGEFLSPEMILSYRQEYPFSLWFGYIKFYVDKERYWLVTRGNHIFDVPDLACFIESDSEAAVIPDRFANIFYYLYEDDATVAAGDTLEINQTGQFLRFSEVPEDAAFLMGPSGTLMIEKINPEETAAAG